MTETRVREATPGDTDTLLSLWTALVDYHKSIERVRPTRWLGSVGETLRPLLEQVWAAPDRHTIFVAEIVGDVVGFVRVSLTEDRPCPARIDTLFVAEGFRGRRVGTRLLDCAYAWCRQRRAEEVAVAFIAPNDLAREFYDRAGFQPLLATYIRRL